MKIISWNVNGIRAVLNKGFKDFIKTEQPDVICLQETKAHEHQVDLELKGYAMYWNSATKKGYAGTAIFTKIKPLSVTNDMGIPGHDDEGRIITMEFKDFFLVTVYTPNAQRELTRLKYRQKWDKDFLAFLKIMEKKKPVVVCGDLNVAHKEIDLARPKQNRGNAGFTDEEREGFTNYVNNGFMDIFREFHSEPEQYTWWSYMFSARQKNIGWRIDYFLVSEKIKEKIKDAYIRSSVLGSDHCPIGLLINYSM